MQNRLSISFRHKQNYDFNNANTPVFVQCNPDGTATYVPGVVPGFNWVDMTAYTEGLENFSLSWTAVTNDYTQGGSQEANEFGSNYNKGVSADLRFFDVAFQYIYDWLMTNECQILNAIEVKITDNETQKDFRLFELKPDNIRYQPYEEPCIIEVALAENDQTWHSFQTTVIEDDWQGWFNKDGTSTFDHPTFGMVVEKKPKFFAAIYSLVVYLIGMLSTGTLILFDEGKRWIRRSLGICYYVPAPLVRTYMLNICQKFGYTMNTMFDDLPTNKYRDVCLFWPVSKTFSNFDSFTASSTKFIWENRTGLAFSDFLNQLKKVFNAEWYVTPNKTLVFQHKSFFDTQTSVYDFTAPGAQRIWFLTYSFSGNKKPAYGEYDYQLDPQDTCSNEVKWRYNSIVDFDGPFFNPLLEGNVTKSFDFSTTAFQNDGSSFDWLEEAVKLGRLIAAGALTLGLGELFTIADPITAALAAGALAVGYGVTNNYVNTYFNNSNINGMVRSGNSEVNIPRLLLWDRTTPMNDAKVISVINPAKYLKYNSENQDYYTYHPAIDAPAGYFSPTGTVNKIYNYPMMVDEKFINNLYDNFHEYDNPLFNTNTNQTFEGTLDMCDEMLTTLGVWSDSFAKIGGVVILEKRGTRLIKGRITDINPSYKDGTIKIKGNVLK